MEEKLNEQQQARNLFYQTDLTRTQIAELLNVNRKTLYGWAKEGAWQRAKYAAKHMPCMLSEQYYDQLGAMNSMIAQREERPYPTKEEADIIRIISMTIKNFRTSRKPVQDNIELFIDFAQELRLKDKSIEQQFMPHMDDYVQKQISKAHGTDKPWSSFLRDREEDQRYEEWLSQLPQNGPLSLADFPQGFFNHDFGDRQAEDALLNNGVSDGVTNGVSGKDNDLNINTTPESNTPIAPVENNEKWGDQKEDSTAPPAQQEKAAPPPTDDLDDEIKKITEAWWDLLKTKRRNRRLRGPGDTNNKAA